MVLTVVEFASTMPDIEEYKTIEDAASHPDVSYTAYWIRRLAQKGKIQAIKVGPAERGQWLVYMPSLLAYIKEMDELGTGKHAH
jgi:hypothetical protein